MEPIPIEIKMVRENYQTGKSQDNGHAADKDSPAGSAWQPDGI
jgi:hypothetical protein